MRAILDNYAALCRYCDSFFESVSGLYKNEIRCSKGCSACCELHSVCAIEACAISAFLAARRRRTRACRAGRDRCALLVGGECSAYPARPVICRTHGAALRTDKGATVYSSCNRNFTRVAPASLPRSHVLDTAAVTGNLMRLNMAFCMAAGDARLASKRFTMEQVRSGTIPERILVVKA
jgi:Fe-S-cluster containining protein